MKESHSRFRLADDQLRTAIGLFVAGADQLAVITLAGAADGILSGLTKMRGKITFTESIFAEDQDVDGVIYASAGQHAKAVNNLFFVNSLKHFDRGESEFVQLRLQEAAVGAILKALANYVSLEEHDRELVLAFRVWIKQNLDPELYNVDSDPDWKPIPPS